MRSRWDVLHSQFQASVCSHKARGLFEVLKGRSSVLAPFPDGPGLVTFFNSGRCSSDVLDEKDRVAGALVDGAADRATSELAIELLLLGLWPGLTSAFGRLLRRFDKRPTELASEIVSSFAVCVRRLDLRGCNRVVSTLIRNTERVVLTSWTAEMSRTRQQEELSPKSDAVVDSAADEAVALADLRIWLSGVVPGDVDLVLSVAVRGKNCHQAGAELGLNHERARKRFARAVSKIRGQLRADGVPDRGGVTAFLGR